MLCSSVQYSGHYKHRLVPPLSPAPVGRQRSSTATSARGAGPAATTDLVTYLDYYQPDAGRSRSDGPGARVVRSSPPCGGPDAAGRTVSFRFPDTRPRGKAVAAWPGRRATCHSDNRPLTRGAVTHEARPPIAVSCVRQAVCVDIPFVWTPRCASRRYLLCLRLKQSTPAWFAYIVTHVRWNTAGRCGRYMKIQDGTARYPQGKQAGPHKMRTTGARPLCQYEKLHWG